MTVKFYGKKTVFGHVNLRKVKDQLKLVFGLYTKVKSYAKCDNGNHKVVFIWPVVFI